MAEMQVYGLKEENYTITINKDVYQKMTALGEAVNTEVQGLMVVDIDEKNRQIVVEDLLLPKKQEVTDSTVDMDAQLIAELLEPLIESDPETFSKIKGWWHTHNDFCVFWSQVDSENIRKHVEDSRIFVSIVTNTKGELLARVDKRLSDGLVVCYNDVEVFADKYDEGVIEWVKQVKKTIKKKKLPPLKTGFWGKKHGGFASYADRDYNDYEPLEDEREWAREIEVTTERNRGQRKGWKDNEYGYIPPNFALLDSFSRQAFFNKVAKSKRKLSKKDRKKLVSSLLRTQQEIEDTQVPIYMGDGIA